MKPKPTSLPNHAPDPITALLRTRPDAVRGVLKAFGWTYHSTHGWRCGIWLGDRSRLAILDLRTLSWRVGPEGKRDTWRGWLGESFRWYFKSCGTPREWWPLETARLIQKVAGPWPELQAECERQRAAAVVACSAWVPMGHNQHAGGSEPGSYPQTESDMAKAAEVSDRTIRHAKWAPAHRPEKGEAAAAFSTTAQMAQAAEVSEKDQPGCAFPEGSAPGAEARGSAPGAPPLLNPEAASGLIEPGRPEGVQPLHPLLECHGWPYEPDQAPNVVTFLRPWNGPRGGGAA